MELWRTSVQFRVHVSGPKRGKVMVTYPLALALVIVARDHVPITAHLTPAVQAPIVRFGSVVGPVARVHGRAIASSSTASNTTTSDSPAPVDSRAGQDGRVGADYRARDGHAGALELRVYGSRPAPDGSGSGDGGRVRRCDVWGVATRRHAR